MWVGERSGLPTSPTKRVSPVKTDAGPLRRAAVVHQDANALEGVSGSLQEPERALSEFDPVAVRDRHVRELRSGSRADVDLRAGPFREFQMSGDEVGMDVGLDNLGDLPTLLGCRGDINIDVPLGVDDGRDALRPDHVGCVGQASQIESFNLYRFHAVLLLNSSFIRGCGTSRK